MAIHEMMFKRLVGSGMFDAQAREVMLLAVEATAGDMDARVGRYR